MILLFTYKCDAHPSRVLDILEGWGISVFRLNTEAIITDYNFSWWANDAGCDFFIENKTSGRRILGSQITAIWDRRYTNPSELSRKSINETIDNYKLAEAKAFLDFLRYYLKDVYSIGSIVYDAMAESKFLQLSIAQELGMKIPDTCVSNIKGELIDRLCKNNYLCIKPLSGGSIVDEDNEQEYSLYTQRIENNILRQINPQVFSETANYIQKYIDKRYELRVTVCRNDIVTCRIDSQHLYEDKGKIDWRQGYDEGLRVKIIETPEHIRRFCLAFLQRLKLNFGCFDFVVTNEGYVFLECNPNGQWMWIEQMADYDISTIIARNLAYYENIK
jgi:glutathione synthase/RimK-type ligase-like ATP-grasp enzyme